MNAASRRTNFITKLQAFILAIWLCNSANAFATSLKNLPWRNGPMTGFLGGEAQIKVPNGYRFLDRGGTHKLLELLQNPTSGSELGVVMPTDGDWFVVFQFSDVGYVKDDEKNSLDANKMLASIRRGTEQGNEERKQRGWPTMTIIGWAQEPRYDEATHNLEWAIKGESEHSAVVNYNVRLLGRHGVMEAALVTDPMELESVLPDFKSLLKDFSFTEGNSYAEFRKGDKVAEYGLAALITGGAAAVALKTGLLQKFWKLIVVGVVAVGAAVKKFFRRVAFGKGD